MRIRRDIKRQPIPARTARAAEIARMAVDNPLATDTAYAAALATMATRTTALEAAIAASTDADNIAKEKTRLMNEAAENWNLSFDDVADRGQTITGGDSAKIISLGMDPYETGDAPSSEMTQVLNVAASTGDFEGTIDLQWDRVKGARTYVIQMTTTPTDAASWKLATVSVKTTIMVEGLASGTTYYFRVAAVGIAGQGPWSDLVGKMAA